MIPLTQARGQIAESFAELSRGAEKIGATSAIAALAAESERLRQSTFVLALVGERGSGKSTLANALIGTPLLPARPVPTTAVVHEVEHGDEPKVSIAAEDGSETPATVGDLVAYAEGGEHANARGVRVRIRAAAEILRGGVRLLDTPGTNDLSLLGADVTYGVLPDADAVVLVLDATQPLKRSEREFLLHRLPVSARERTVAVLARADLLGVGELEEAQAYAKRELEKVLPGAKLHAVSAKNALERGDKGFDALKAHLMELLGRDRARLSLLRSAGEGVRLAEVLGEHVRLRREAMKLAAEDLEAKLVRLQRAAPETRAAVHEACARVDARAGEIAAEAAGRLADFTEKFRSALPREIDAADEADLRKYLPFFLEDTLRAFAEGEAERVEGAMTAVAYDALTEFARAEKNREKALDLGAAAPVNVEVDTLKYDVGVVAAGALGTMMLFSSPLLGILLLAGAPVLHHVLKGKVAGRVRDVAKEQALRALDEASTRLATKLREEILSGASRIREAVLAHGDAAARDAETALAEALAAKRGGTSAHVSEATLNDAQACVSAAERDLRGLAEALE
jgi:GTPase SAR1 family protein